ncbi:MAG: EFR1 family ferrodoxin [Prevotella sp.]|nr:EFR1 family ferrodoxin [Prevotella sp.]
MIFYFTGTGNTRWVAQQLAEATGEELLFIPDEMKKGTMRYELKDGERLGFCFPTHGWQPPRIVREFIRQAQFMKGNTDCTDSTESNTSTNDTNFVYAVTTCGDNMGHAMRILNKELKQKGLHADSVFAVLMPESNVCFSFLHLDTKEREREKIATAQQTVAHICEVVSQRRKGIVELIRGAIPYTYTYIIGGYYNKHLITDEKFWVDSERCISCGLCARLCPVDDIEGLPPRWKHDGSCTNCLACYHHCPQQAIHWGKMKRGQYVFSL